MIRYLEVLDDSLKRSAWDCVSNVCLSCFSDGRRRDPLNGGRVDREVWSQSWYELQQQNGHWLLELATERCKHMSSDAFRSSFVMTGVQFRRCRTKPFYPLNILIITHKRITTINSVQSFAMEPLWHETSDVFEP